MAKTKRRGGVADNSENLVYLNRSDLEKYYAELKKKLDRISEEESPTSSAFFNRLGEVNKHFLL